MSGWQVIRTVGCALGVIALIHSQSPAAEVPTSRPTTAPATRPATRPTVGDFPLLDRLAQALTELKLDANTDASVQTILDSARDEARTMRQELASMTPHLRRERILQFSEDIREKLGGVLDEQQRTELRSKLGDRMQPAGEMPGRFFEQIRSKFETLKLDDEQRQNVQSLFDDARKQLDELRSAVMAGDREARAKAGDIMRDTQEQLNKILSPEQREQLRSIMPGRREGPNAAGPLQRGRRPAATQPGKSESMMGGEVMSAGGAATNPSAAMSPKAEADPADLSSGMPERGQPAPDFELRKLEGQTVKLSSFKGKVTLLVFGSFSSATLRERASALEELRKDLGTRASILLVYTREAHPSDGWKVDRNEDSGVNVSQPRDSKERELAATKLKQSAKIATPILLDTMDDQVARAYGAFPNGAVLIGRDGNVAYRQKWFDPVTLRRHIDEEITGKSASTQPTVP